jgi:hypothetical protein
MPKMKDLSINKKHSSQSGTGNQQAQNIPRLCDQDKRFVPCTGVPRILSRPFNLGWDFVPV